MDDNYIVSWTDIEGNEWLGDWIDLNKALELFYSISGCEENKVDETQVCAEIWSDDDNKTILKYDYISNQYYSF